MSKHCRGHDHLLMITALKDFQIGAAGQGGLDRNSDFTRLEWARLDLFDANIFFAVKDRRFHEEQLAMMLTKNWGRWKEN